MLTFYKSGTLTHLVSLCLYQPPVISLVKADKELRLRGLRLRGLLDREGQELTIRDG